MVASPPTSSFHPSLSQMRASTRSLFLHLPSSNHQNVKGIFCFCLIREAQMSRGISKISSRLSSAKVFSLTHLIPSYLQLNSSPPLFAGSITPQASSCFMATPSRPLFRCRNSESFFSHQQQQGCVTVVPRVSFTGASDEECRDECLSEICEENLRVQGFMAACAEENEKKFEYHEKVEAFEKWMVKKIEEDGPLAVSVLEDMKQRIFRGCHPTERSIICSSLQSWLTNKNRVGSLSPLHVFTKNDKHGLMTSFGSTAQVSTSVATEAKGDWRRSRESLGGGSPEDEAQGRGNHHEDSSGSGESSDDERPRKRRPRIWYPEVVEFPNYAAKEEEKFFHELLAFPWQKGRADRYLQRLEEKYFPNHGLDSFMLKSHRKSRKDSTETFVVNAESEDTGISEDRSFERFNYPKMAKALSSGFTTQEKFQTQRSRSGPNQRSMGIREVEFSRDGVLKNEFKNPKMGSGYGGSSSLPSIRTIRGPLYSDRPAWPALGNNDKQEIELSETQTGNVEGLQESSNSILESTSSEGTSGYMNSSRTKHNEENMDVQEAPVRTINLQTIQHVSAALKGTVGPLIVKSNTKLPRKWNEPGGTVVLIDKPKGWTSFAVCEKLRHLVKVQKVGHAGTLDPMATGLLIVCVGQATKLADSFQALPKVYTGTLRLGEATRSSDAATEVNERRPWEHVTDQDIQTVKESFVGDIMQIPPIFSAIKVQGERLYEKARRGEEIDIPARKISVYEFQIRRSKENRQDLNFRILCSKGTYVRSICADLGRALNSCAHMTALRREKIGEYSVGDAWDYLELADNYTQLYL